MARKTKGELVSDLELRFTAGKPSDDFELMQEQIAHWLDVASNAILSDYFSKQLSKGGDINPEYINKSAMLAPASENITDVQASTQRYAIDISSLDILPIRGFSRDYGVIRISDKYNKHAINIRYGERQYFKEMTILVRYVEQEVEMGKELI